MTRRKSVKVWTWRRMLRDHGPRKPGLLLTLHTVGTWMDGDGYCHPSQKAIAKGARITERTVRRHVEQAVELGWLHTEPGPMGGQKWRRTAYQATVPLDVELSDTDEELTDTLHSQCGDVGEDCESPEGVKGADTIMSSRSTLEGPKGADTIVSSRYVTDSEKVRTSDAKVRTSVTEGADTGDRKVRTQLCPTNSPVNSPIELSNTEGATDAAPLPSEKHERTEGPSHVLDVLADSGVTEPVRQGRKARLPVGTEAYRRNAVIRLSRKGYGMNDIAKLSGLPPAEISAVLSECAQ